MTVINSEKLTFINLSDSDKLEIIKNINSGNVEYVCQAMAKVLSEAAA